MNLVDAVFNTAGVGGVVAGALIVTLVTCYFLTVRWISNGHKGKTERQ